ncbi:MULTISPECIES: hypothetical protein [Streptomyces]|nr:MULTISPECIES: hypothetical protein [Streptomyces]
MEFDMWWNFVARTQAEIEQATLAPQPGLPDGTATPPPSGS